jgi:hypothetical protein
MEHAGCQWNAAIGEPSAPLSGGYPSRSPASGPSPDKLQPHVAVASGRGFSLSRCSFKTAGAFQLVLIDYGLDSNNNLRDDFILYDSLLEIAWSITFASSLVVGVAQSRRQNARVQWVQQCLGHIRRLLCRKTSATASLSSRERKFESVGAPTRLDIGSRICDSLKTQTGGMGQRV